MNMTANQVVAYNLRRAREELGMTQEVAADELWRYLNVKWSKASFSAAESSANEGGRKREFDANELLAFSRVFRKPIAWFFTPPADASAIYACDPQDPPYRTINRKEALEAVK